MHLHPAIPGSLDGRVVRVVSPGDDSCGVARLHVDAGGVWLEPGESGNEEPALWIGPGWVDVHAHVYDAFTTTGVEADRVGLTHGVHLLADAGTAGASTVQGLVKYVLPTVVTPVVVWLNIGLHGLVHLREIADPTFIDTDITLNALTALGPLVRGIKVRSSGLILGNMGLEPLRQATEVARTAGLPLMVHIGEAPPNIRDVLEFLDDGDVVTHCFHGKPGNLWHPDGTPIRELAAALARGVQLDVGHGAASFSAAVAHAAIAAGWQPHSISTDIHARNISGPVYSIATVMTKLLHAGMTLSDVIQAVTDNLAER